MHNNSNSKNDEIRDIARESALESIELSKQEIEQEITENKIKSTMSPNSIQDTNYTIYKDIQDILKLSGTPIPTGQTQNIYYGAQSSLDPDISITEVGMTPNEVIDRYITRENNEHPPKIYGITYPLYKAILDLSPEKRKLNLFPPSVLLNIQHTYTSDGKQAIPGLADLKIRSYPYISHAATTQIIQYFKNKFEKYTNTVVDHVLCTVQYKNTSFDFIEIRQDEILNRVSPDEYNNAMFKWCYCENTTIMNSVDTTFINQTFERLIGNIATNDLLTINIVLDKLYLCVQLIFTHTDTAPIISIIGQHQ